MRTNCPSCPRTTPGPFHLLKFSLLIKDFVSITVFHISITFYFMTECSLYFLTQFCLYKVLPCFMHLPKVMKFKSTSLWITFYDIEEKCFDSLWLEDCINSLWDNGIKDDTLSFIYYMNAKANVIVKTPFGDTDPMHLTNIVKQGTVLGPMLNNCSLNRRVTVIT